MNKKRIKVTDGGYAIPLGNDYFLMRGQTHEQGGIGIGKNKKNSIEVENGEIVKVGQKDIKVFSDQPMLNGISPANALLMGARPKDVFTAQQAINGNSHGIYGKDGLIKNIVNWIKGSNDNVKSNKEPEPIDWNEIKLRQAYAESGFNSDAMSKASATGMFQITPKTLQYYNEKTGNKVQIEDLTNDSINTSIRDWYMDNLYNREWISKNNPSDSVRAAKTLIAYNWGPDHFRNALNGIKAEGYDIYNSMDWINHPSIPKESKDYVNFILRNINNSISRNQTAYEVSKKKNSDKVEGIRKGFKNGGQINMKVKNNNKIDITKEVMDRILPISTGERKKFLWGGTEWSLLGNIGTNLLSTLGQGITGSIAGNKLMKMYKNLKRESTYIPVAREHINTRVNVEPQLTGNKEAEAKLIRNAQANTSNSKVAREQMRQAVASRVQADHTVYGDKLNRETQLRNAEAELQTRYNLVDNQNIIKDLTEKNDFEMQRQIGMANVDASKAQNWGAAIAQGLKGVGTAIGDYATMKNDLLKSNNPAAYAEYMKFNYGHLLKSDGTLKDIYKGKKKYEDFYNSTLKPIFGSNTTLQPTIVPYSGGLLT